PLQGGRGFSLIIEASNCKRCAFIPDRKRCPRLLMSALDHDRAKVNRLSRFHGKLFMKEKHLLPDAMQTTEAARHDSGKVDLSALVTSRRVPVVVAIDVVDEVFIGEEALPARTMRTTGCDHDIKNGRLVGNRPAFVIDVTRGCLTARSQPNGHLLARILGG